MLEFLFPLLADAATRLIYTRNSSSQTPIANDYRVSGKWREITSTRPLRTFRKSLRPHQCLPTHLARANSRPSRPATCVVATPLGIHLAVNMSLRVIRAPAAIGNNPTSGCKRAEKLDVVFLWWCAEHNIGDARIKLAPTVASHVKVACNFRSNRHLTREFDVHRKLGSQLNPRPKRQINVPE